MLVVGVVMYPLTRLQRQSESLLVVGDRIRKGPPFVKALRKSLETHVIGMSWNTMEQKGGSFGLVNASEGRTAMFNWRFG